TVAETRKKKASAYSLVVEEESPFWRWLYEFGGKIPLVQSAYGNTVYTYPSFSDRFMIYVTTSGFIVESIRGARKSKASEWLEEIWDSARPQPKPPKPR
ncbi:hypothetical protein JW992_09435, partial [candidate division KSB1 bacterium]|nr:hypothetical protein [candidate division KSB1 bacterium]